jgi:Ca2+-binding EF-hand superfamily protein
MKLSNRFLLLTLAAAIALPVTASAAKGDRKKKNDTPETTFATLDKDGDGVVTEQEYVGLMGKTLGESAAKTRFGDLDKDKNGKLSKEEYTSSGTEKKKRGKKNKNQE